MASVCFSAKKRVDFGSVVARRLRRDGRLPGVIYGRGETVSVDIDAHEFAQGIKGATESTIVKIDVDGKTHEAFVKATQRNIMTGSILHVDFYEIETDKLLRARVSIHVHGNPVGVRDGGILETSVHEIEVECLPKRLPERINVDVSNLKTNQTIHVRDLDIGSDVKLISAGDQVVAAVHFAKVEAEAQAPVAEETSAKEAKPSK